MSFIFVLPHLFWHCFNLQPASDAPFDGWDVRQPSVVVTAHNGQSARLQNSRFMACGIMSDHPYFIELN